MTKEEFVKNYGEFSFKPLSNLENEHYTVNQPQFEKLLDVYSAFIQMAKESDGQADLTELVQHTPHGGVSITCRVFDAYGDGIQRLCKALSNTASISISVTDYDKVHVSAVVPDVLVPKEA